jgi:hypothetical protein
VDVKVENVDEDDEEEDDQQTLYFVTSAPTGIIGSPFPPQFDHNPKREEEKQEL